MTIDSGEPVHEVIREVNKELLPHGLRFEEVKTDSSWYEYNLVLVKVKDAQVQPS